MPNTLTEISLLLDKLESLKSFNETLVEAINTSHEGIALLDYNGIYIYMNTAHENMFGYDKDELIGKCWTNLYSEKDVEWFSNEVFPYIKQHGKWSGEAIAICKDRKTLVYENLYLTLLPNGSLICTCRNKNQKF